MQTRDPNARATCYDGATPACRPGNTWHGWVLHGLNEDLELESDRTCFSQITDVRLRLHYALL